MIINHFKLIKSEENKKIDNFFCSIFLWTFVLGNYYLIFVLGMWKMYIDSNDDGKYFACIGCILLWILRLSLLTNQLTQSSLAWFYPQKLSDHIMGKLWDAYRFNSIICLIDFSQVKLLFYFFIFCSLYHQFTPMDK